VLLCSFAAPAQDAAPPQDQQFVRPAPPKLLAQFDVMAATVQGLTVAAEPNGEFVTGVVLGGIERHMVMHMHDMRSHDFQLLVEEESGIRSVPRPTCVTYRGALLEEPTARVVATIIDGSLTAEIHRAATPTGPGETWCVQPVRTVDPNAGARVHIVYRAADNVPLPFHCGNVGGLPQPQVPPTGVDVTLECDIAVEGDIEFYQQNGSNVTSTQNDITAVMNSVEFIYNRDCDVQYAITTIVVSTTAVYSSSSAGTLLTQFRNRWNSVHTGIQRDVAHLFTGRNLSGSTIGIATLGTICNTGSAYGLSQSRFTSNMTSRVGLTAHELGHSWNAGHCNSSTPCYIMCSGLGGCQGSVTLFGPSAQGQITSFAQSRSCLVTVPVTPVISSLSPNIITVFEPGTIVASGSGFNGTTSVRVGAQTMTSGFTVVSDDTLYILPPEQLLIGITTVAVTTPLGTSNSMPLVYTFTIPPKIDPPPVVFGGNSADFRFGGQPAHQWFLMVGLSNSTSPFLGHNLLNNSTVLSVGVFDTQWGFGSFSIPVPPGLGLLTVYSQVLEANSLTLSLTGTSEVGITILL